MDIEKSNVNFRHADPLESIAYFVNKFERVVLTTNFRPYEAAIIHACYTVKPDMDVIWCDSGYNTKATYRHIEQLLKKIPIRLHTYVPRNTKAYRDVYLGVPDVGDPNHQQLTEELKLEPFRRAMADFEPEAWFTNLRKGQSQLRDSLDVVSKSQAGVWKVSPFYHFTDVQMDAYLKKYQLPIEWDYEDPTKVEEKRECGLHTKF
ncbi:MAG: phosphoadenosine phosphosulfate reductase family protein [Flavobacteriaceae bacterium]|nr:phosphoadenosine phosphosulfate reductase family protein [Flavobacteriaceae bacterium]